METTGPASDPEAELVELGAVLLDPGRRPRSLASAVRPGRGIPVTVGQWTGTDEATLRCTPPPAALAPAFRAVLAGRVLIAQDASLTRHFLARGLGGDLARARWLDALDLLALTHPDAPHPQLGPHLRRPSRPEQTSLAPAAALAVLEWLTRIVAEAGRGEARYAVAHRALSAHLPDSAWLSLLATPDPEVSADRSPPASFVDVGVTREERVPFDEDSIVAALRDPARGARHLPGFRVREEQVELARHFVGVLRDGGTLLLEGGTGVGKSLAYLAASIPFAMERERRGEGLPVLISTRTKLLQDQLLRSDIPAAARLLGYPELRALSIKGRANYACQRRLAQVMAEGREPRMFSEERMPYAVLAASAGIRGELGSLPGAWLRRYPTLADLLRRAVSTRSEQCTREQCAAHPSCALGRRRTALGSAHLAVANHDLLLRWPPDYPVFAHAVVDEVQELADVADEVFALSMRPEEVAERLDELLGPTDGRRSGGPALLSPAQRRALGEGARGWRGAVRQDLVALGRALEPLAGELGEVQLPQNCGVAFDVPARCAEAAAARLDQVAHDIEEVVDAESAGAALARALDELRQSASTLRVAFHESSSSVACFEGIEEPWDRWRLAVRLVSPARAFRESLLDRLESFAGVSASLFVGGDALAALGELGLEPDPQDRAADLVSRASVPSPFPYAKHMRVVALARTGHPVDDTSQVIEQLARRLGGRTLGLFTSLRRMREVAELLSMRLHRAGIEVIVPRRASDDPAALVARFRQGPSVLLGARRFWQGLDLSGDALQAVVIEKLPFEVPSELRRRRERRLAASGVDAFDRYTTGKMLLNLKQMVGRLIRSETDRGIVVVVDARTERSYFRRVEDALPPGCQVVVADLEELDALLAQVGLPDEGPGNEAPDC